MTFIELIRNLRIERKLLQRQMAAALAVSEYTYQDIETGQYPIKEEHIPIIAKMFRVNAEELRKYWIADIEKEKQISEHFKRAMLLKLIIQSRKKCRLTMREMGKALGITKNIYSGIESGKRRLRKSEIYIIADMLNIQSEQLINLWLDYNNENEVFLNSNKRNRDINRTKNVAFLKYIKQLRKAKKFKQSDMGKALGIAENSYSSIETGRYTIKREQIIVIAKKLEISPEELLAVFDSEPSKKDLLEQVKKRDVAFFQYIKQLMKEHKLSQRKMVEQLGIDRRSLCNMDIGRRQIREDEIIAFAEFFKMSPKKMFSIWIGDNEDLDYKKFSKELNSFQN